MHRTKQSLSTWFWAAYLVTSLTPSISAVPFQKQLGLPRYETAFCMLHKLRAALVAPGRDKFTGDVEIDEGYIGGREEGCSGRGVERKQIVVGAVELVKWVDEKSGKSRTRCGRVRFPMIPDVTSHSLQKFVRTNVARGAEVVTDGYRAYSFLGKDGYHHRISEHADPEENLKSFHRVFSNLKSWLGGTYHGNMRHKHLQAYLNEFTFRFNRRFFVGTCFNRALGLAMATEGPTYERLYRTGLRGGWRHPVVLKPKATSRA